LTFKEAKEDDKNAILKRREEIIDSKKEQLNNLKEIKSLERKLKKAYSEILNYIYLHTTKNNF
jgi:hypothetical protein